MLMSSSYTLSQVAQDLKDILAKKTRYTPHNYSGKSRR